MFFFRFICHTLFILAFSSTYIACVEDMETSNDPQIAFTSAKEYYDDGSFDLAVQKLGEFKSRFPYSKYSTLAELFIANSNFELGNYEQAANDYKQFVKLHPKHEKAPFAMYRVGEAHWIDAPEKIDRDQDLTVSAITEWGALVDKFPDSQYATRAKSNIAIGKRRIAESNELVAAFYCKQEIYHACAFRSMQIVENHKEYKDIQKRSLLRISESMSEIAQEKHKNPDSDKNVFLKTMTEQQLLDSSAKFKKLAAEIL